MSPECGDVSDYVLVTFAGSGLLKNSMAVSNKSLVLTGIVSGVVTANASKKDAPNIVRG